MTFIRHNFAKPLLENMHCVNTAYGRGWMHPHARRAPAGMQLLITLIFILTVMHMLKFYKPVGPNRHLAPQGGPSSLEEAPTLSTAYQSALPSGTGAGRVQNGPYGSGHSGPQGKVVPLTIIDDPADWKAKDLKPEDYTYQLSEAEVAETIAAADAILGRGVRGEGDIKQLTRDDYLPHYVTLAPKLRELADSVSNGRGFLIIRGFPVEHYKANRPGLVIAYWGWALVLGRVQISQTDRKSDGTLFGSIFNHITMGRFADVYPPEHSSIARANNVQCHSAPFHSDLGATDLISLLSIAAANEGGESRVVSAVAIHNELLCRGRKDLVELLSTPGIWWMAKQQTQRSAVPLANGSYAEYEETQPFQYHNGYLSVNFRALSYGHTFKKLTPLQEEAIRTVTAIAEEPDFHVSLKLQPGDIEWLHNPSTWHARTEVVDAEVGKGAALRRS